MYLLCFQRERPDVTAIGSSAGESTGVCRAELGTRRATQSTGETDSFSVVVDSAEGVDLIVFSTGAAFH